MADEVVEDFRPTSGRITGGLALAMVLGVLVIAAVDPGALPAPVVACVVLGGVLVWAAMLRPRMWVTDRDLVMRNMLSTVSIPLAAIEQIVVRQVCAVSAGEKRYVSPAVGRSWRQTLLADRKKAKESVNPTYATFVEERLLLHAERGRRDAGIALLSDEQLALASGVRHDWAWPEIVALVLSAAAVVVTVVL